MHLEQTANLFNLKLDYSSSINNKSCQGSILDSVIPQKKKTEKVSLRSMKNTKSHIVIHNNN